MSVSISSQAAWLIVFSAMGMEHVGRMSRAEAERLMDEYFDICEQARRRMFPETGEDV
jgi:hypothetical protein